MTDTITIERMGYGAEAVGHLASGKTVFVEGGAPGDMAEVQLVEEKASFARARIQRLVEPSPLRVAPEWPDGIATGAAPWQHLSYGAQLSAKRDNVASTLVRTAHLPEERAEAVVEPCVPSKRRWGYRNKLELACADEAGRFCLGFHPAESNQVIATPTCPLAHRSIQKAPKALQGALRFAQGSGSLGIYRVGVRNSLRTGETEIALWTPAGAFPRAHVAKTLSSALKATSIVRVMADPGHARKIKGVEVLAGKGFWEEQLGAARYMVAAPSFFQVNTAQAERLVDAAIEFLGGTPGARPDGGTGEPEAPIGLDGLYIADLYAGGGTFSIPIAQAGAEVVAVESAGSSVRDLRRNADANGVFVDVVGGDAARELPELGELDALVVDPPRAGLADGVVESIAAASPERVVYISCNPATWARDVARFESNGYRLARVRPVDLFPQTYHVEVASLFERA